MENLIIPFHLFFGFTFRAVFSVGFFKGVNEYPLYFNIRIFNDISQQLFSLNR